MPDNHSDLTKRIDSVVAELLAIKAELLIRSPIVEPKPKAPESSAKEPLPDRLLTQDEAAELLAVEPQTLSVWRANKRYGLPYVKVGRNVRYRYADLLAFIESRTVAPAGDP